MRDLSIKVKPPYKQEEMQVTGKDPWNCNIIAWGQNSDDFVYFKPYNICAMKDSRDKLNRYQRGKIFAMFKTDKWLPSKILLFKS